MPFSEKAGQGQRRVLSYGWTRFISVLYHQTGFSFAGCNPHPSIAVSVNKLHFTACNFIFPKLFFLALIIWNQLLLKHRITNWKDKIFISLKQMKFSNGKGTGSVSIATVTKNHGLCSNEWTARAVVLYVSYWHRFYVSYTPTLLRLGATKCQYLLTWKWEQDGFANYCHCFFL